VLNVLVAQIVLQGASILAVIGQLEAAGMAQHVRMDGKRHLGGFAEAGNEMMETHRADWSATLANEYVGLCRVGLVEPFTADEISAAIAANDSFVDALERIRDQRS
jgi:hypothetical protein